MSMHEEHVAESTAPESTHAEWGAGNPHLIVSSENDRRQFDLTQDVVTIGSGPDTDLTLPDTDPLHATITHDDRDEYVVTMHGAGETNANLDSAATHGAEATQTLRTGARFTAGPWSFVYSRDEFADHGRPHGGRQGGELSDQEPQQSRPDYNGTGEPEQGLEQQD